jgi:hypothetical protein
MPLYRNGANLILFVHIPKTGGTTIEAALRSTGAAEALRFAKKRPFSRSTLQHMHAHVYKDAVGPGFYDWAFAVVRNPFNRFASEYKMKVLDAGGTDDFETFVVANIKRFGEYKYTRDNHIRPQREFISKDVQIFRFEDGLEAPIKAAVERLELPQPEIPHAKKGRVGKVRATERSLEMIASFYQVDFKRLGYESNDYESAFELVRSGK